MLISPILATKLFAPPLNATKVSRPRLLEALQRGQQPGQRLTLVCAPAGYGKTTLVGEWARTLASAAAWLSLDPSDNDPNQFLAYLTAAISQALPSLGLTPQAYLGAQQTVVLQPVLAELINRLAEEETPLTLILDDYQFITAPAIHAGLTFWLDHLPPHVRLLLATRADPPLPLHRYRARGQMVELRADDLRFTTAETARYLTQAADVNLGRDDLAVLDERIEGWAAGLQMAVLSFARPHEVPRIIQALAGSRRYILDYLAEEVLNNQPAEIQRFLLTLCLFDRFCAPLCDAATDSPPGTSETRLEALNRANLFLVPLDAEGHWYRFHHLFADLLRMRLKQPQPGVSAEEIQSWHMRAAAWFARHGHWAEAIHQALESGDYEQAADLVEQNTIALLARGELHALVSWIERLPQDTVNHRPWLCLSQAWALAMAGKPDEAGRLAQQAAAALEAGPRLAAEEQERLQYEMYALRMMAAVSSGRAVDQAELEKLAGTAPPSGGLWARSAICWAWGYTCRSLGRLTDAAAAFETMRQCGLELGNLWTTLTAALDLATVFRLQGRLREAVRVYRQSLDQLNTSPAYVPGFVGRLESLLAVTLYEQNDLAEAHRLAEASLAHNRGWQNPNHDTHACLARAMVALAEEDLTGARGALEQASQMVAAAPVVLLLRSQVEAGWARYWLASRDNAAAQRWAEAHRFLAEAGAAGEPRKAEQLALARVLLAGEKKAEALTWLKTWEGAARATGQMSVLIEILALQALAMDDKVQAQAALLSALTLGEPEGFARVFVDLGEPMRRLLSEAARRTPDGLRRYIDQLLAAFPPAAVPTPEPAPLSPQPADRLVEALTEREVAVLACLVEGLTNPQIGRRLYISVGTVKAHTAAIFRKLDVANRTEAVARAKDLRLL